MRIKKFYNHFFELEKFNLYISDYRINMNNSITNYNKIHEFYYNRKINIEKFYNSGVFLVLLGYYLSNKMDKPIEIYGLDIGVGGKFHFDNSKSLNLTVLKDEVKEYTRSILNVLYNESNKISNYSNFYGNMTGYIEQ